MNLQCLPKTIVVAVGGVRGVGKTTLLQRLSESNPRCKIIHFSRELKSFSLTQTGVDFFAHEISERDELREVYCLQLLERIKSEQGVVFLDLHFTDIREGKDKIIQPKVLFQRIDCFVLADALTQTILNRRVGAELRGRSLNVTEVHQEQEAEKAAIQRLSSEYHRPLLSLQTEVAVDETVEELINGLERHFEIGNRGKECL